MRILAVSIAALVCVAGCAEPACQDLDGDGYGPHCRLGPDCDDHDAARNTDCVAVPPPDCNATPEATGCPCFAGSIAACFPGSSSTRGVGSCRDGNASCTHGYYGLCTGAVTAVDETCDGLDDDCDGSVDESVTSPCGGCDPGCTGAVWGPTGIAFVAGNGLDTTPNGFLELARTTTPHDGVYFVNSGENTISHVDSTTGTEVARHASGGVDPRRVAVDYLGDVFVANAAFGAQGTLTKLGRYPSDCIDRNASNTIDTSTGPTDVPALAADECIVYSVPIGAVGDVPRALAIDGSLDAGRGGGGDPWIGLWNASAVVHVDGLDGSFVEQVDLPGMKPYAAAFDSRGRLWIASQEGELARIDRSTPTPTVERVLVNLACYSIDSIAMTDDDVIVATGDNCDDAFRFDPNSGSLAAHATLPSPRGVAILGSTAFVAHTDGRMSTLDIGTLATTATFDAWAMGLMPIESIGVAIDDRSTVWMASVQGGPSGVGVATRFDPATGAVLTQVPLGIGPRVHGDPTGRALRGSFVPSGSTGAVFAGCPVGLTTHWLRLHLDFDQGAASSVVVELRFAGDVASLPNATFATLASFPPSTAPVLLDVVPNGGAIELRLSLFSNARDSSPVVRRVGIEYTCLLE